MLIMQFRQFGLQPDGLIFHHLEGAFAYASERS
jgi:hypothetical protein